MSDKTICKWVITQIVEVVGLAVLVFISWSFVRGLYVAINQ